MSNEPPTQPSGPLSHPSGWTPPQPGGPGPAPTPLPAMPTNTDPGPSGDANAIVPPEPKIPSSDIIGLLTGGRQHSGLSPEQQLGLRENGCGK
jgi:hypothetical protein